MTTIKCIIGFVLILSAAILMVGCSTPEPIENTPNNEIVQDNTNIDDIQTEPITSDVVAVVNGEEIKSDDVSAIQQLFLQQGQEVSEEEALEQVINQKIIEQEVEEENIVVTNQEAEAVIEQQLSMQGLTLDDYKQQLESQGVSYEAELENIKTQVATQNYLQTALEGQSFNATQAEVDEFYEVYKAQSTEEVAPLEELQTQIIAQIEQQKQQQATSVIIQELRSSADVEYQ